MPHRFESFTPTARKYTVTPMTDTYATPLSADPSAKRRYNLFLLLVAGLGGLLYGIDVGIIGGALPYLEATSQLTAAQLSVIVAAVLLGSVFSTLFAGALADWMGRKPLMVLSGVTFVLSIPVIALSRGYGPLFFGRLLQGVSGGLIGVVVPLYLAECLARAGRGPHGQRRYAVCFQGPGLAAHLLAFASSRRIVYAGQPAGDRVAALALPAR